MKLICMGEVRGSIYICKDQKDVISKMQSPLHWSKEKVQLPGTHEKKFSRGDPNSN